MSVDVFSIMLVCISIIILYVTVISVLVSVSCFSFLVGMGCDRLTDSDGI